MVTPVVAQRLPMSGEALGLDEIQMRSLVRDLHRVSARTYWIDLLLTASLGWASFCAAVVLRPFSLAMLMAMAVAALLLYRTLCFMHEISHQNQRTLPHFEAVWNSLIGYPLLMPSFMYVGVHNDHHKISTYGTPEDPEYLPFARSRRLTTVFAVESLLIPAALLIRFLILTPIGFLSPRFQKWLVVHASSLTINMRYERGAATNLINRVRRQSVGILVLWASAFALMRWAFLPWRLLAVWYVICATASFVNTVRTLGAHAYESSGEPLDRTGQLFDSIDTPGTFWTELWAPVGLRYHALHHYFPGIPYHNLPEAYRRLVSTQPMSTSYQKMSSRSLLHSLRALYQKARTAN
jgi:fatty acid desaturase